jgi:hypothetical protein
MVSGLLWGGVGGTEPSNSSSKIHIFLTFYDIIFLLCKNVL